jgi:predicted SprT family Zn-dependent metalloprotease
MIHLILKILLALKMAPKDKDLQQIYNSVFADAMKYTDQFNVQMVAATYIAIAMRLYKTSLTPQEYEMMVSTIMETEVKSYFKDKETMH